MTDQPSQWAIDRQAEWDAVLDILRAEGWAVTMTAIAAPLQLEGQLPSGESFYFRARWDEVRLGVGGDDPSWSPAWEGREQYGTEYDASYLPGDDGLALLRRLFEAYRSA